MSLLLKIGSGVAVNYGNVAKITTSQGPNGTMSTFYGRGGQALAQADGDWMRHVELALAAGAVATDGVRLTYRK